MIEIYKKLIKENQNLNKDEVKTLEEFLEYLETSQTVDLANEEISNINVERNLYFDMNEKFYNHIYVFFKHIEENRGISIEEIENKKKRNLVYKNFNEEEVEEVIQELLE